MAKAQALPAATEKRLQNEILKFVDNPEGFVRFAFDWGEPGPLAKYDGADVWQAGFLKRLGAELRRPGQNPIRFATKSGHGIGKVQCNRIVVPTPSGERLWGDIQVGDCLFDREGQPTEVLERFDYTDWPFYRVEFDDGSYTFAGPEHLWAVRGRQERRKNCPGWRVMSTQDILDAGVLRSNGPLQSRQWEIPTQGPAQFEPREIPVHPYILGVWLGDGNCGAARYSKPYPEIVERIRRTCSATVNSSDDGTYHYLVGHKERLVEAGVLDLRSYERYVPDDYKFNTEMVRRYVLEGLLDTDGECANHGSIGYSTTSKRLADDVVWLARSLGGKATIQPTPKQGWYPDEGGLRKICRTCYRVTLNLPWNPFTLEHRRERYKPSEARYTKRFIAKIEFSHYGDGHCVIVDNSEHLYQANDFIVTHNSTLISWIILWFLSTRPHPQVRVTANTRDQLLKTTFRELALWHKRAINSHWFTFTATKLYRTDSPDTWFAAAVPWSAENSEAFAGLHAEHVLVIFDEGSNIHENIFTVTQGAMTTNKPLWLVFGNPTRNTGSFYECFGSQRHRWITTTVDSRTAKLANKDLIQTWIDDYGEDSDFVRVRVLGEFPRAGSTQFIPNDLVDRAMANKVVLDGQETKVLSVDVARFGSDQTVFLERHGSKVLPLTKYRGLDTMQVAALVAERIEQMQPDCTFVDGTGLGAGVVDRLRSLNYRVIDVQAGAKPDDPESYFNKRSEMWGRMREWLRGDVELPKDDGLKTALTGVEYGYSSKMAIQLEKKDDMKKRGLASPDEADALAYSFAEPVRAHRQILLPPGLVRGAGPNGSARRFGPGRRDLDWRVV